MLYFSLFISFFFFPFFESWAYHGTFPQTLVQALLLLVFCQGLKTFSNVSVVQGTTFVLQKNTEPRQRFLSVISKGTGVMEV